MDEHRQVQVAEGAPHHVKLRRIELQPAEVGATGHHALGPQLGTGIAQFGGGRLGRVQRHVGPEHQAVRGRRAVLSQRRVDGTCKWYGELRLGPVHVAVRRHRDYLQVLPCGIHTGQADFRIRPAREVLFKLGAVARTHGSLTLRRTEPQNPFPHPQLDIAIGVLFEERPPVRVLVVVARMGCVSVQIDKHVQVPRGWHFFVGLQQGAFARSRSTDAGRGTARLATRPELKINLSRNQNSVHIIFKPP
ncbi:hypothetical protein D3C76_643290 [compost metagenome]